MTEKLGSTQEGVSLLDVINKRDEFLATSELVGKTFQNNSIEEIKAFGRFSLAWRVPEGYQLVLTPKDDHDRHTFSQLNGLGRSGPTFNREEPLLVERIDCGFSAEGFHYKFSTAIEGNIYHTFSALGQTIDDCDIDVIERPH